MEYYILKNEDSYITLTTINDSNVISHGFTDNVEQARRYEDLNEAKKQAELFDLNVEKIIITKEIM